MTTRLRIGNQPIRQNKNLTANFVKDLKEAKRTTVFHLVDLKGADIYVMKMTSKYIVNLSHSDKPMYRYFKNDNSLIEYSNFEKNIGGRTNDIQVGNYVEVNAEITI